MLREYRGFVPRRRLPDRSWLALGYLVVFGSLMAFSAYSWLLGRAPIEQVATYAYVNPVVAVALGALLRDEPVTPLVLVGGGVIVAAVAVVVRQESRAPAGRRGGGPGRLRRRRGAARRPAGVTWR